MSETTENSVKKCPDEAFLRECRVAVTRESVSFSQLINFKHKMKYDCENKSEEGFNEPNYSKMLDTFEAKHGKIIELHMSSKEPTAVALTERVEEKKKVQILFIEYCPKTKAEILALFIKCDQLKVEANRYLIGQDLENCIGFLYSSSKALICMVDGQNGDNSVKNLLELAEKQLEDARTFHDNFARLRASSSYFMGVIIGTFFLVLAVLILPKKGIPQLLESPFVVSCLAGSVGALVSVIQRMDDGKMRCEFQLKFKILGILGFFRPIIGSISGVLLYALLTSKLISITSQDGYSIYTYTVLGFISGFSERWFQDMLLVTKNRLPKTG